MNIIVTIPEREDEQWVNSLFKGSKRNQIINGRTPLDPPVFPFSRRIAQSTVGGFLYLVYDKEILGYEEIMDQWYAGTDAFVGAEAEGIGPGTRLRLARRLEYLPSPIPCVGFRNFRYTKSLLHKIGMTKAQNELRRLGLKSP